MERLEAKQLLTRLVDFDTDGDLDAYYGSSLYENTDGKGNLQARSFSNANGVTSLAADLDGDGDWDFVTSEPKWYENLDGRGRSFASHAFVPGDRPATRLNVQDVGADGDTDVILFHDAEVTWYENRGVGQGFTFHALSPGPSAARITDAADLDRDGDLDVILKGTIAIDGQDVSGTFLGVGNNQGGYTPQILQRHPVTVGAPMDLAVFKDINGDGLQDIVLQFTNEYGSNYSWLANDPAQPGTLLPSKSIVYLSWFSDANALIGPEGQKQDAFVDWDQDGDLDVAGLRLGGQAGHLWKNNLGTFNSHSSTPTFDIPFNEYYQVTSVGDLTGDGTIDWVTSTIQDGLPIWYDGANGAPHQNRLIPPLQPGDANRDLRLDEADLIAVAKAGRWGQSATWATGDWNGAPGGTLDVPRAGDGRFDASDLQAFQATNLYRTGAYAKTQDAPVTEWESLRLSLDATDVILSYDAATGRVELRSDLQLSAMHLHSLSGLLGANPVPFAGPFDLATAHDLFRFDLNGFNVLDFGTILPAHLSWEQVQSDLKIDGARAAGGALGKVGLTCTGCGLDVEGVRTAVASGTHARWSDLDGDAQTNANDLAYLLKNRLHSSIGDANLDGSFNSTDLLQVFQQGKYESPDAASATWADGDWNGDSRFDSSDLTFAFQVGNYDGLPTVSMPGPDAFQVHPFDLCVCWPDLSAESVLDLDGDGDRDILVSNTSDSRVVWYENLDGLGTFSAVRVITTQISSVSTAIASDVDGDGDLDVLASSFGFHGQGVIHWYENVGGKDVFRTESHVVSSDYGAHQLALGDLDRDGDSDLVVGQSFQNFPGAVIWYTNDGKGHFSNPTTLETGQGTRTVAVTDLDGDNDLDIFAAYTSSFRWFANDGTGKFTTNSPVAAGATTSAFDFGDLDGDGKVDILGSGWDVVSWFRYTNGGFQRTEIMSGNLSIGTGAIVDIDQDGDRDLAFSALPNGFWVKNNGQGVFGERLDLAKVVDLRFMQFSDFDGDGDHDLTDGFRWHENLGTKFLLGETIKNPPSDSRLVEVDLDGDQDLDQVSYDQSNIFWRENENGEGFLGEPRDVRQLTEFDRVFQVAFDDVDWDGDVDIIAGMESRLSWFENRDGHGHFELNREFVIDGGGSAVATMADLDGDGKRDLLTSYGWLPKKVAGGFGARRAIAGYGGGYAGAKDLDLDGDLDLLVSDTTSKSEWFENLGSGQFQQRSVLRPASASLDAADLDRDGDVDIVFSDWTLGIGWLERLNGTAVPTYQNHLLLSVGGVSMVHAIDHDEDGDIDIVTPDGAIVIENLRLQ